MSQEVQNKPAPTEEEMALFKASQQGDLKTVKSLLALGTNVNAIDTSFSDFTSLIYATRGGHAHVVLFLLQNGADKTLKTEHNEDAMVWARHKKFLAIVELLEANKINDGWHKGDADDRIYYTEYDFTLGRRITEVFNFKNNERMTVSHNFKTGGEGVHVQPLREVNERLVREAAEELTKRGGQTPDLKTIQAGYVHKAPTVLSAK